MEEITQPTPQTPPTPKQVSPILTWVLLFILGMAVGLMIDKTTLLSALRIPYLSPTPTPLTSPKPTAEAGDPTANWKTYSDKDASFKYPENIYYFTSPNNVVYFYSSESNKERCRKDIELATHESLIDFSNSIACITELTYSAVSSISVQDYQKSIDIHTQLNGILPSFTDSQNRKWDIMNEEAEGTRLIALTKINDTYRQVYFNIGGNYTINNFIPIFHQILSTFKFLDQTSTPSTTTYTCPPGGWVDCMPSPDQIKPECSADAMAWYKANCPNFKGGAL